MTDDEIKLAIVNKVIDILEDAALCGGIAFTVYRDFEIESMASEPARPFAVVGTRNTGVIPRYTPFIGIDVENDLIELQLGTPASTLARTTVNAMARYEGEASQIVGVIKRNMISFVDSNSHFLAERRPGSPIWSELAVPVSSATLKEAGLSQWIAVSAAFQIL